MKQKKLWITVLVVLGFLFVPMTGYAFISDLISGEEDIEWEDVMDDPDTVEQGGVEVESERFPIDSFSVNNEAEANALLGIVVSLANMVITFNAYIVYGVDTILNELFTLNPIERFSGMVNLVSQSIYETLQDYFGQLFFIFAIGYIVYLVATKGTFREAVRRSVMFVLVLVFAGFWMLNSGYFMQVLNSLSLDTQGYLIDAGSGMVANVDGDGVFAEGVNVDHDDPMDGTIAMMRNVYFDLSLKRPYLIVNYGATAEEDVINDDVSDTSALNDYGGSQYDRYERMLAFDATADGQGLKQLYVENVEADSDELANASMGGGSVYTQLGQTLIGLFVALLLAVPFGALGLLNFLLQLMALGLAFFLPFALIISYIPHFANSGFNVFMKLVTVFVVKAMLGLVIMFVYTLTFIVDTMIPPDGFGMYLANVVVLIALLFVLMVKRNAIVKLITAGRVQSMDKNFMEHVNQRMVNPAVDKTAKGMSIVSPTAGRALNQLNQAKDRAVRQTGHGSVQPQTNISEPMNQGKGQTSRSSQSKEQKAHEPVNQAKEEPPSKRKGQTKNEKNKKGDEQAKVSLSQSANHDKKADHQGNSDGSKAKEKKRRNGTNVTPSPSSSQGEKAHGDRRQRGDKDTKKEKPKSKPVGETHRREKQARQPQSNKKDM